MAKSYVESVRNVREESEIFPAHSVTKRTTMGATL